MERHYRIILAVFLVILLTTADNSPAAETIKLGVAGAHSGDLASYGLPSVKAAELVVKQKNAQGGVLGRKGGASGRG